MKKLILLGALFLATMAMVGAAVVWRVLQRASSLPGSESPSAFAHHGGSIYLLHPGEERPLELVRTTLGGEPEILWRGEGTGEHVFAGEEGVVFSICLDEPGTMSPCNRGRTYFRPAGGAVRVIDARAPARSAAFHGGKIYLVSNSWLRVAPVSGGPAEDAITRTGCTATLQEVVADETAVYWSDYGDIRALRPGTGRGEVQAGLGYFHRMVVRDGSIYLLQGRAPGRPNDGRVLRIPTSGGAPEVLVDGLRSPTDLVVTDTAIVVAAEEDDGTGILERGLFIAPRDGGPVRRWASLPPLAEGMATDGERLFVGGDWVTALVIPPP